MNHIKRSTLFFSLLILSISTKAQDTLRLSSQEYEAIFLKENLSLMAEKLEIPQAEAQLIQAKLWPNPTITLDQVNLWATPGQTGGNEVVPPLIGDLGRNQQFAFEIEQLIITAGKRKKLMDLEQVSIEKSKQYFEDILRNLKLEFRGQLINLQHLQFSKNIYINQLNSVRQLTLAYQRQVELSNIAKGELIRLKALELDMAKNINSINTEIHSAQKELKLLMHLSPATYIEVSPDGYFKKTDHLKLLMVNDLIIDAKEFRPDYQLAILEQSYTSKLLDYEVAQKTPDLALKALYDRNGSTMLNFVGFGVSIYLPFFNRNQGNIKHAQIGVEQSEILAKQKDATVEQEAALAYQNLLNAIDFIESIEPNYENSLDELLESYTTNFTNRNISLLEYLDFLDAYLENKKIILEATKDLNEKAEELNYAIGKEVIN